MDYDSLSPSMLHAAAAPGARTTASPASGTSARGTASGTCSTESAMSKYSEPNDGSMANPNRGWRRSGSRSVGDEVRLVTELVRMRVGDEWRRAHAVIIAGDECSSATDG